MAAVTETGSPSDRLPQWQRQALEAWFADAIAWSEPGPAAPPVGFEPLAGLAGVLARRALPHRPDKALQQRWYDLAAATVSPPPSAEVVAAMRQLMDDLVRSPRASKELQARVDEATLLEGAGVLAVGLGRLLASRDERSPQRFAAEVLAELDTVPGAP